MNSGDAMMLISLTGIVMSLMSLRSDHVAWRSDVARQKSNRLSLQKASFERAKSGHVASPSTHGERPLRPAEQDATGSGIERFTRHKDRRSAQPSRIVSSRLIGYCREALAAARRIDHFGNSNVS
jgi:hypothetical protein